MASKYFIKLEQFEGPLDLLLQLIRVHELDIFHIDLLVLTTQYLDYLRLMKFKDLQDAASFMEMAATLIEIKSRQLLPNEKDDEQSEENLDEEDLAINLQKRLLEYSRFQQAAEALSKVPQSAHFACSSSEWSRLEPQFNHLESPLRGDPSTLLILYEQMLSELAERKPIKVKATLEAISVDQVIIKIKEHVEKIQFFMFQQLFEKMTSRYELVAHILAILQLVRDREMKIFQQDASGPIWLYPQAWDEEKTSQKILQGKSPNLKLETPADIST